MTQSTQNTHAHTHTHTHTHMNANTNITQLKTFKERSKIYEFNSSFEWPQWAKVDSFWQCIPYVNYALAEKRLSNTVSTMFFEQLESMTTCCNNRTAFEKFVDNIVKLCCCLRVIQFIVKHERLLHRFALDSKQIVVGPYSFFFRTRPETTLLFFTIWRHQLHNTVNRVLLGLTCPYTARWPPCDWRRTSSQYSPRPSPSQRRRKR